VFADIPLQAADAAVCRSHLNDLVRDLAAATLSIKDIALHVRLTVMARMRDLTLLDADMADGGVTLRRHSWSRIRLRSTGSTITTAASFRLKSSTIAFLTAAT